MRGCTYSRSEWVIIEKSFFYKIFQSTDLWARIIDGKVIPETAQNVEKVEVPALILGDGAFPFRTWLMKPHGDAVLPPDKRYFNFRHSRARLVTEGAFGRLKSRFRVLFRKCESQKETVKVYSLACVVLHNICIDRGDLIPRKFDLTLNHAENKRMTSEEVRDMLSLTNLKQKNFGIDRKSAAKAVRSALTKKFWKEKETQWLRTVESSIFQMRITRIIFWIFWVTSNGKKST